jgi:hypothetical protein
MSRVAFDGEIQPSIQLGCWGSPRLLSDEAMAFARCLLNPHRSAPTSRSGACGLPNSDSCGSPALPNRPRSGRQTAARAQAGQAIATLRIALAAIRVAHLADGQSFDTRYPAIQLVMKGIARKQGSLQRQAEPMSADMVGGSLPVSATQRTICATAR